MDIRRNAGLSAGLGLLASVMTIAYLRRASEGGSTVDWLICAAMAVIALIQLVALMDSRTPLLVADDQGVRIRLGREWLGLPWNALEQVVVEQREGPLPDGRLVLAPRNLDAALETLEASARREVWWQRTLHGAPLTVPISLATRADSDDIVGTLRELADGRTDVVSIRGRERAQLTQPGAPVRGRVELGALLSRLGGSQHDLDQDETSHGPLTIADAALEEPPAAPRIDPVAAIRAARDVVRAEVVREERPRLLVPAQRDETPIEAETDDGPEMPLGLAVIDEFATTPAAEPVIGPEIQAARNRAGLSVETLSERTRIRPHVLEALEQDDFGPCGGDFYARGHLQTLARFLGLDGPALVASYDEHYSHAPINARRVFEAELATGLGGGLRATNNGPRWSLIAAAVMSLLMVWGVARFFTATPTEVASPSPSISDSAGLAANTTPITSPLTKVSTMTVRAVGAPSRVVVRDRTGQILWQGRLMAGDAHRFAGVAPFMVQASNGAATAVRLRGHEIGTVGTAVPGTTVTPATRQVG